MPELLYRSADAQGNAIPSPAYSQWLSELPEPMSPSERYMRELQSYPTGALRLAKRKRADNDDGEVDMLDSPHVARLASVFQPPYGTPTAIVSSAGAGAGIASDHPKSPHVAQYEMHGHEQEPSLSQPMYKRNSLPLLYESPLRRCPVQESDCSHVVRGSQQEPFSPEPERLLHKLQHHKLQKKWHYRDDEQEQQSLPKQAHLRTMSQAFSRRDGHSSAGSRAEVELEKRPATSHSFTRRLSTIFRPSEQGPRTMEPRRWSFSFRPSSRAGTPVDNGSGGGHNSTRVASRLSGMFRGEPPRQMSFPAPRVLDPHDNVSGDYRLQIAFVGDATVGKSCLIKRFLHSQYVDREYNPTNKDQHLVLMSSNTGVPCRVEMHDCGGGQEESDISHLTRCWWDAVVVCFSVGDATTLAACLNRWVADARQNAEGVPIILAGLKTDRRGPALQLSFLQESEVVSRQQAEQAARAIGADMYVECSAKYDENVADLFRTVVSTALPRVIENAKRAADRSHGLKPRSGLLQGTGRILRGLWSRDGRTSSAGTHSPMSPPTSSSNGHADGDVSMGDCDTLNGTGSNGYGTVSSNGTWNGQGTMKSVVYTKSIEATNR